MALFISFMDKSIKLVWSLFFIILGLFMLGMLVLIIVGTIKEIKEKTK